MPKETFQKLNKEKKLLIQRAFFREFAIKSFDDASITQVVMQLGIAKGSIYQYFENKVDLYIYLMMEAGTLKANLLEPIKRESYATFWEYLKDIYSAGITFDNKHFLESNFLYAALNNVNSPSIRGLFNQWNKAIHIEFTTKIQYEIDAGLFHNELPASKMAFILQQNLTSINDYLKRFHGLNIAESIQASKGIYHGEMANHLLETVDEHFILLKKAFDNNINR